MIILLLSFGRNGFCPDVVDADFTIGCSSTPLHPVRDPVTTVYSILVYKSNACIS